MGGFNKVEEAFMGYLKGVSRKQEGSYHKAPLTLSQFFSNRMLVISSIRQGVPFSLLELLIELIPFTEKDWVEFLDVSSKTLQRYKKEKGHVFKSIHSEKILEIAEVAFAGQQVFESDEKFYQWLNAPSFALGGSKPINLLKDSYGKEIVLNELNRIDHGIFI